MRWIRVGGLALVLTFVWISPARAACSSAVPSFPAVAETAEIVVVGRISNAQPDAPNEYASVFQLTVEHVLRGSAEPVMEVRGLLANPGCGTLVIARDGDRIALAIDGTYWEYRNQVSAVAYLEGTPHRPDIQTMTLSEVFAAASVPLPDTAALPLRMLPTRPGGFLVVLVVVCACMAWVPIRFQHWSA